MIRTAVARVAPVSDVDATVAEGEPGALLDEQRILGSAGVGVRGDLRRAREGVEPEELVMNVIHRILDRGDDIDRVSRRVDHGRRKDAERIDVAAADL